MINAVLVFNNAGQPRLTKFYTQLVDIYLNTPSRAALTQARKPACSNASSLRYSHLSQIVPTLHVTSYRMSLVHTISSIA